MGFLAWRDFHPLSCFAHSAIAEQQPASTPSLHIAVLFPQWFSTREMRQLYVLVGNHLLELIYYTF